MQFYTLNQIINNLTTICNNHAMVKQFEFGEQYDISASLQQKYPLVWANVTNSNISDNILNLNMQILIMDIQKADSLNEKDTLSDCLSIARDIYAALNNPIYGDYYLISQSPSLIPIREAFPDLVNGWQMDITFQLPELKNRCQIPIN